MTISNDRGVSWMLKTAVFEQLKTAMKEKDVLAKGVLTLVKSALDLAEKEKGEPLTQPEEIAIINREVKQTNQALEGAQNAGRADLIEKEEAKLVLLKTFLPKQLSEAEIAEKLLAAGVSKGMNMGEAMKIAKPLLSGQAEGAVISKVVKSLI